jgi:hypothetical protein
MGTYLHCGMVLHQRDHVSSGTGLRFPCGRTYNSSRWRWNFGFRCPSIHFGELASHFSRFATGLGDFSDRVRLLILLCLIALIVSHSVGALIAYCKHPPRSYCMDGHADHRRSKDFCKRECDC